MKGLNNEFLASPTKFLGKYTVDNMTWERGNDNAKKITAISATKQASFEFAPTEDATVVQFRIKEAGGWFDFDSDKPIDAYFCPFEAGKTSVGHIDIPRQNAAYSFVFTPAMHGCHLEITPSPLAGHFRIWHNQHPDGATLDGIITAHGARISSLVYSDYAGVYDEDSQVPQVDNAFNFLYRVADVWHYVTQPSVLVAEGAAMSAATSQMKLKQNHSKARLMRGAGVP